MGGKAGICGMRVTVGMMVEAVAAGRSATDLPANFPYLEEEDKSGGADVCGEPLHKVAKCN
jgi:hypothetical protein